MAKIPLIAGNWKMCKDVSESITFVNELKEKVRNVTDKEILLCPSFPALVSVKEAVKDTNIKVGAQNVYFKDEGYYTGEVSPKMIKDYCEYVIIGHSERRQYFKETDYDINKKLKIAMSNDLKPILCIGETLEQREKNEQTEVIQNQLKIALDSITDDEMNNIVIAYEPVWAIGTGKTATPEQAEEIHILIREELEKLFDNDIAVNTRILYGGSVNPDNIKNIMEKDDIDGVLVGGASLEVDSFVKLIKY